MPRLLQRKVVLVQIQGLTFQIEAHIKQIKISLLLHRSRDNSSSLKLYTSYHHVTNTSSPYQPRPRATKVLFNL